MVTGVIQAFDSESRTAKTGKRFNIHKVCVDGTWYETGFSKPSGVGIGDAVSFEVAEKFGKLQVVGVINRLGATAPASAAPMPAATPAPAPQRRDKDYVPKAFPVPALHPDRSIIRQNALSHATKLFIEYRTCGNRFDGYTVDAAADEIIKLAYKFEKYATGQIEVDAVAQESMERDA